jgi:sulfide dehydrogenase [flavocytochrome c] flavoprotein chain
MRNCARSRNGCRSKSVEERMMKRRYFLLGAAPVVLGARRAQAATAARMIVIGGGIAGVSAAKYLRLWGGKDFDVTLIDRDPAYTSCIASSQVLIGQRSAGSLRFGYEALRNRHGVKVLLGEVAEIDPVAARVRLADGTQLQADRLVVAPGIDFDPVPGLADAERMPHAWKGGAQTLLLAKQLAGLPAGGVVALTIPKAPYRCPPGPYERACLIADWLKAKKPRAKLIVLDANPDFVTDKDNFSRAFFDLHGRVIEYRNNVDIVSADAAAMTLATSGGAVRADVINLIPQQRAPALLRAAGLANSPDGRFAAVDVLSYASTAAPRVHVIGDACATTQPKSGHMANQEAKVCADAIVRLVAGGAPDPAPVTNSACYSTITMSQASWLSAVFQYDPASRSMKPVAEATGASRGWNSENFKELNTWFRAIMTDSFG